MMNDRNIRIVIPVHPGKDVKPGLVRAIIKEAGLSRQDFLHLLAQKSEKGITRLEASKRELAKEKR